MNSSASQLPKPDVTLTLGPSSPIQDLKPEERGIKLIQLLLTCANHASSGNLHHADACLQQISQLASITGDCMQRLAARGGGDKTADEEEQQLQETSKTTSFNLNDYTLIKEGEAEILMHAKNEVFFNKTQALSASGLRALRYAREVEGIGQVVALDNDKASVEACQRNIKFNGSVACSKSHLADARVYMLTHPKEFDVVDLNTYGSPSVFLGSALQSVVDGGILMCTATHMAILCGGNGEVCYSKYGSYPLKGKYCHEMALRVLLASIENNSVRYLPGFGPVVPQECSDCGKKYNMGGPIWSAPILDQEWVTSILEGVKSMKDHYPAYS
ncbi:hypothetical protein ACH5RR_011280 [Cinchona calisaya]|uniref:tRNA (guanine(26)-N(2))-dimethyltransferase n=1 Tax=Cinchona calisaya TaxID=153742 RepID=A0ABD3A5V6_9GENT